MVSFLLLVCECNFRARNTAREGSHFRFAERDVIFSMASWLTERTFLEFSAAGDDLGPARS